MKTFKTEILVPDKVVYSGPAESLVLNGARGYFGVLAGHAPFIARLAPGRLKLAREGKETVYRSGAGFAQVDAQRVSVLLDEIKEEPAG